jgi:hypothetical protein
MVGHFRVLGVDLSVEGPKDVVAAIGVAYGRFKIPASARAVPVAIPEGSPDAAVLLYQRFLATVLLQVERHAVFHGAALVDRAGGGLLLAGPSGHGKSSLALELVRRGFGFLGDDYAPVDLAAGTVWPFPRTASVRRGGSAPLPPAVRALAEREGAPTLFGKALVDVGDAFGASALAAGPVPVRTVVVLAPAGADPSAGGQVSWMLLGARADDATRLGAAVRAIPGVVIEEETENGEQRRWRLRVEHPQGPTEALGAVVEDDAVLYSERAWSGTPDFEAAPAAAPLKRREAAVLLTRELLNRRRGSRFLAGRPDGLTGLVLEVAHALRETQCWRVQVGRFVETADLVEQLTERSGV